MMNKAKMTVQQKKKKTKKKDSKIKYVSYV